ncbi:MAG TPA: hypothetical protein VGM23_01855 [Armatimonadota bacterium]|jgi:hypothetical protein
MRDLTTQLQVMEILARCEEATGDLYRAYAGLFPEMNEFWGALASQEDHHAVWVRGLMTQARDGKLDIQDDRFVGDIYREFYDYLVRRRQEIATFPPELVAALSIALDIEGSFVEKSFLQVFEGDSPQLRDTLRKLTRASEVHRQRIQEQWQLHRRGRLK